MTEINKGDPDCDLVKQIIKRSLKDAEKKLIEE